MISFNVSIFETLLGVLALVVVDWAFGILTALRTNSFSWPYLYHQLEAQGIPFGALALIGLLQALNISGVAIATGALTGLFAGATATYVVKLGADIVAKLGAFMGSGTSPAPTPPAA